MTRKERLVGAGHKTKSPSSIAYLSVVSRDSVQLDFTIADLNDIDICAYYIGNEYLNINCRDKLWIMAGVKFGSEKGSVMIISKELYDLKSSGAAWNDKLAKILKEMIYKSTEADPDVWLKLGLGLRRKV